MRTAIVSTSKLKTNRRIVFIIDRLFLLAIFTWILMLHNVGENWISVTVPMIIYLQFHIHYSIILKLRNVSYDQSSVYFNKRNHEVWDEKKIFFKASAWYPFNFQKKDHVVNEFWDRIDQYKKIFPEKNFA